MNVPRFRADGPPPNARDLNAIASLGDRRIIANRGFVISAEGVVDRVGPEEFLAKLTAADGTGANPYSWAEAKGMPGGGSAIVPDGRTGSDAYEVNDQENLGGQFVTLRPSEAGDWRFAIVRQGSECEPSLCVTLLSCYDPPYAHTATITVKHGSTTVASCSVTIGTASNPICCFNLPAGTYSVFVVPSAGLLATSRTGVVLAGCATTSLSIRIYPATFQACVSVLGCEALDGGDGHVEGATVEFFDHAGDSIGTCMTDSTGQCCITVTNDPETGPPPFPWHIHTEAVGYDDSDEATLITVVTPDAVHGCGAAYGVQLTPDADHVCCPCLDLTEPVPRTIDFVDGCGATGTLTWGAMRIGPAFTAYNGWFGCLTYTEPNGADSDPPYTFCTPQEIEATIFVGLFCQTAQIKDVLDVTHTVKGIKMFPVCRDDSSGPPFLWHIIPADDCSFRLHDPLGWRAVWFDDSEEYCTRPINISGIWTDYLPGGKLVIDSETTFSFVG